MHLEDHLLLIDVKHSHRAITVAHHYKGQAHFVLLSLILSDRRLTRSKGQAGTFLSKYMLPILKIQKERDKPKYLVSENKWKMTN